MKMTQKQKKIVNRILVQLRQQIEINMKDYPIYYSNGYRGVCEYLHQHKKLFNNPDILSKVSVLISEFPTMQEREQEGFCFVARPYDFSHPDRIALIEYLIKITKP